MSADDTVAPERGVVAATDNPPPLPDASHRNVILTLHAVRGAKRGVKITDQWLKTENGVGQDKQASRLLRFLNLVDARKKLRADVVAACSDWEVFRGLLVDRVLSGCERIGLTKTEAECFSAGSWEVFQAALESSPAVASRKSRSQGYIISCFRELADICEMDEDSFQAEVSSFAFSAGSKSTRSLSPREDEDEVRDHECTLQFGTQDAQEMISARISFSRPIRPGDYRRLAQILQAMDVPAEVAR